MKTDYGYKLFKLRKDGTLGPPFINRRQRIPLNTWLEAENHPTKGFKERCGWHITRLPKAPHLSTIGRVWARVAFEDAVELPRPERYGGMWYIAQKMKVLEIL